MKLDMKTVSKKPVGIMLLLACIAMPIFLLACQQAPHSFEVLSLDIMPPKVMVGEKATVRAELRNGNASVETYNVPLMVNGVAQDRKTVTLSPGATEVVEFSLVKHKTGVYKIAIGDRNSTLEVQAPLPAAFQIFELEVIPTAVNIGEKVVITAKVANTGGTQGTYTAELKINGRTNQTEKVIIAAGAEYMLVFKVPADSPGTYTVALGELSGEFVVIEPILPLQPNNSTPSPPTPSCPGGR
jgi:hypothetical protein